MCIEQYTQKFSELLFPQDKTKSDELHKEKVHISQTYGNLSYFGYNKKFC